MDALSIAGADKTFSYYFHKDVGPIEVATDTIHQQSIFALAPSQSILEHSVSQLKAISNVVDVRFSEVNDRSQADILFYFDSEIDLARSKSEVTLGLTLSNYGLSSGRKWFEVYFNGPELFSSKPDLEAYVFNHELLHVLGLEHTFDDSDGDFYLSTDPQLSASPEQTTMSYRFPESGVYPKDISPSDYNALQQIWGIPSTYVQLDQQTPVYRLFHKESSKHLFSSNLEEIDILTGNDSNFGFINEGIAYTVGAGADQELYRFHHASSGRHFYSASQFERDSIISSPGQGYTYEGVAFRVFSNNSDSTNKIGVFRFYDPSTSRHFYTANEFERNLIAASNLDWINEGIAWYA